MKKNNIIWLLFIAIWAFWFFYCPGLLENIEETNFFQCGGSYWSRFALKPAGWSDYITTFLVQLFQVRWLGALIQTLPLMVVFGCSKYMVSKLEVKNLTALFSSAPFITLALLHLEIGLSGVIRAALLFLALALYLRFKGSVVKYSVVTLLSPLLFVLIGGIASICFYVSISFYELLKGRDKRAKMFIIVWLAVTAALPFIWEKWVYVYNVSDAYVLLMYRKKLMWVVYSTLIIYTLLSFISLKRSYNYFFVELALVAMALYGATFHMSNRSAELFMRMEQATVNRDSKEVLSLASKLQNPTREETFMVNLALYREGMLAEHLFSCNSKWGAAALYIPRGSSYEEHMMLSEFYYELGLPNPAIHLTFQASSSTELGMDFRGLKRLIELYVYQGDNVLADKYINILENAVGYDKWCAQKRVEMVDPATRRFEAQPVHDLFIGSRPFVSDLVRVLDAGISKDMSLEYTLSYLLLEKDLTKFCAVLDLYHPKGRLPKSFQEAIVIALASNKDALRYTYDIDPAVTANYQEYVKKVRTTGQSKKQAREIMSGFKDTLWYYLHLVDAAKVNQSGEITSMSVY